MNSFQIFGRRVTTSALLGFLTFAVTAAAYFWPNNPKHAPEPATLPQTDPIWVRVEKKAAPAVDVGVLDSAGREMTPNQKGLISFPASDVGKEFTVINSKGEELQRFILETKGKGYQRVEVP